MENNDVSVVERCRDGGAGHHRLDVMTRSVPQLHRNRLHRLTVFHTTVHAQTYMLTTTIRALARIVVQIKSNQFISETADSKISA